MRILRKSIWRFYAGHSLVQRLMYAYAAYVILCAIALRIFPLDKSENFVLSRQKTEHI